MIGLEMAMPKNCRECPCSYYIRTGAYEGDLICEVLEYISLEKGINVENGPGAFLVDGLQNNRPAGCPMREIGAIYDPT